MTDAERDAVLQLWAQHQQRDVDGALELTTTRDVAEALRIPEDHVQRLLDKVRVEEQAAQRANELRHARRQQMRSKRIVFSAIFATLLIVFALSMGMRSGRNEVISDAGPAAASPLSSGTAQTTDMGSSSPNSYYSTRLPKGLSVQLGDQWISGSAYVKPGLEGKPTVEGLRWAVDNLVNSLDPQTRIQASSPTFSMETLLRDLKPGNEKDSLILSWEDLRLNRPGFKWVAKLPFSRTGDPLVLDAARKERRRRIEEAIEMVVSPPR
jgi:hypothetical protein